MKQTRPIISACIIAYNQQDYIAACLQGALMQQLDVPYEIVVSDDCSTDRTLSIVREYAQKDDRIRVIERGSNVGMHQNWLEAITSCKGEFVAICEGDDYWTDPLKLQKQLRVLEGDSDLSGCFSNAEILSENGEVSEWKYVHKMKGRITATDFFGFDGNPIPTCTLMFRRSLFNGFPPDYYKSPFADWILHTLLIQRGDYSYLPESTSSYRQHTAGVWSGLKQENQLRNKLKALSVIRSLVRDEFKEQNRHAIRKQLDAMLYFYKNNNLRIKYLSTWLKLKTI